jgi:hypothetical protein
MDPKRARNPSGVRAAGVVIACTVLAACSSGNDVSYSIFVDPGKYKYHSCAQIASEIKNWSHREQELKDLLDKAEQSTGGAAVGLIAYKAEYVAAGEELEQLHGAARSKSCAQDEGWRSSTAIR